VHDYLYVIIVRTTNLSSNKHNLRTKVSRFANRGSRSISVTSLKMSRLNSFKISSRSCEYLLHTPMLWNNVVAFVKLTHDTILCVRVQKMQISIFMKERTWGLQSFYAMNNWLTVHCIVIHDKSGLASENIYSLHTHRLVIINGRATPGLKNSASFSENRPVSTILDQFLIGF
jgi:hypothetical protein